MTLLHLERVHIYYKLYCVRSLGEIIIIILFRKMNEWEKRMNERNGLTVKLNLISCLMDTHPRKMSTPELKQPNDCWSISLRVFVGSEFFFLLNFHFLNSFDSWNCERNFLLKYSRCLNTANCISLTNERERKSFINENTDHVCVCVWSVPPLFWVMNSMFVYIFFGYIHFKTDNLVR